MDKALFIYNPLAGSRNIVNKLDYIIQRFHENNILIQPFRIFDEEYIKLIEVFKKNNFSYVIVSGGDGTLNSVVNIMLKNKIKLPIGIIPSGTSNDLARFLSIPLQLKKNIDMILKGTTVEVDVGLINDDTYFLSSCAGGNFVDVAFETNNEIKRFLGPLAYYLKGISEMAKLKPFSLRIQTDNETFNGNALFFVIINGKDVAGLSNVFGEANFSDGLMDILIIKACTHLDLANIFLKIINGNSLNDKNVIIFRTANCHIESETPVTLSIDGEKGSLLPVNVRFLHKFMKIFV